MKVCTDSCLLGAYASHPSPQNILDIGTGTGLLALMLAQKYPQASIVALEPDHNSFEQAGKNFQSSPWRDKLNLLPERLQDYQLTANEKFDLIICNPPFYPAQRKKPLLNKAAHSFELPVSAIVKSLLKLLSPKGFGYILYPPEPSKQLQMMVSSAGLYPVENLYVKNNDMVTYFRVVTKVTKQSRSIIHKEISIYNNEKYSQEFTELMKDYYLFL